MHVLQDIRNHGIYLFGAACGGEKTQATCGFLGLPSLLTLDRQMAKRAQRVEKQVQRKRRRQRRADQSPSEHADGADAEELAAFEADLEEDRIAPWRDYSARVLYKSWRMFV